MHDRAPALAPAQASPDRSTPLLGCAGSPQAPTKQSPLQLQGPRLHGRERGCARFGNQHQAEGVSLLGAEQPWSHGAGTLVLSRGHQEPQALV